MKNLFAFFCCLLFLQSGFAQLPETFDSLSNWSVSPNASWYHSLQGTALSHNWNNRLPIDSPTNNAVSGAAVFNGDSINAAGTTADTFMLTSPKFTTAGFDKPILSFHQYFKNYEGKARVEVSIDSIDWEPFSVNQNYGNFMETPEDDRVFVDFSSGIFMEPIFWIRFVYEGVGSFWIIDDVRVDDISDLLTPGNGSLSYPETYPAALADSLCLYDYPFLTDTAGGAYIPDEWVILYVDGTTEEQRDSVRDMFQITDWESCNCSDLELWKSPIVIEPIKIKLPGSEFPEINTAEAIGFPEDFNLDESCETNSYYFALDLFDFCDIGGDFSQHTPDATNSEMLVIKGGDDAGFSIPSIILAEDSLYVFSFYAHSTVGQPAVEADILVDDVVYESIIIDNETNWERFDIKLDIPVGGSGIIEFKQTNAVGIYAIDDLCVSRYMLSESDAIGLNGIDDKAKGSVRAQELDKNYYNFDFLEEMDSTAFPLQNPTLPSITTHTDELVIAVLDTGIDYFSPNGTVNSDIQNHLYYRTDNLCYPEANLSPDFCGYDFIDKDGLPYDSHRGGHGTHVASTIIQNLNLNGSNGCDYKILPVRTHDNIGLGTLFSVSCGISYASERGADYINASWGYYAEESPVLSAVINQVKTDNDVMIVCSAGNDATDIGVKKAFPSSFNRPNLITVAATDTDNNNPSLAIFSNRSSFLVHYATEGVDIVAAVPPHVTFANAKKEGTSMAAPRLLASAVMTECHCYQSTPNDREEIRFILNKIDSLNTITVNSTETRKGRFIDTDLFQSQLSAANCMQIIDGTDEIDYFINFRIFPNPVTSELFVATDILQEEHLEYRISDLSGRIILTGELSQNFQSIVLQDFQKGIYFIQIKGQKGTKTVSFVKS